MKDIQKINYKYNKDIENPVTYSIQTKSETTILNYKDALEIAYAVIDSMYGDYNYLEKLEREF